jgi:hypothetical protein
MTVVATSYFALSLSYGIAMLAGSATFQTLANPTTLLGLQDRIIESEGGLPQQQSSGVAVGDGEAVAASGVKFAFDGVALAIAHQASIESRDIALNQWGYAGTIRFHVVIPNTAGDNPPEILRRARNILGAICNEIEAQFGGAGKLARGRVQLSEHFINDDSTIRPSTVSGIIDLFWRSP